MLFNLSGNLNSLLYPLNGLFGTLLRLPLNLNLG